MADFNKAIEHTLRWEGGYSNIEQDRGAETYCGISRKFHPNWDGWEIIDQSELEQGDILPELNESVYSFYRFNYWDKYRVNEICNDKVAGFVFDWIVNSGKYGRTGLQKPLGVYVDGIIGDKTIKAANNYDGSLFDVLKVARIAFVKNIVISDPSQKKFLAGWLNRISSFT